MHANKRTIELKKDRKKGGFDNNGWPIKKRGENSWRLVVSSGYGPDGKRIR